MRGSRRVVVGVLLASLCAASAAAAQSPARSFGELQGVLAVGDYVVVVEPGDRALWGRVVEISPASLVVTELRRRDGRIESGGERVALTPERVQAVFRSDEKGARVAAVYPASWHAVDAMPAGSDVDVELTSGDRRRYRFAGTTPRGLRVTTAAGGEEILSRSDIARVERRGVDDPVGNGIAIGALIGAGSGFAIAAAMYATCGQGCDAPAEGPTYAISMGVSAGIGAAAGWIVDRLHKGKKVAFPVAAPILTRDTKGVAIVVRF